MNQDSLYYVLVVGSGSIAKRHIKNLRYLFPDAVVACVSSSGRLLNAAEVGASKVFPDMTSAIHVRPNFAIIASPAPFHLENARQLLLADIPVLIEKPLCTTLKELEDIDICQHESNVGVAYNLRFNPGAHIVKKLLDEGAIGSVSSAFAEVGQYLPDWRPNTDYKHGVSANRSLGGGALLELSHELDYLNWFFGPFGRALGVLRNTESLEIDVEDSVEALLEHRSGLIAHVHLDLLQRQPTRQFKAIGTSGSIVWDLIRNEVMIFRKDGETENVYSSPGYDRNEMYIEQIRAFAGFVEGRHPFLSSLESGRSVIELVEAIRTSNAQRSWCDVKRKP